MNKILDKPIIVHSFYISPSKFENGGDCLNMQLEFGGEKRILFTRGSVLIKLLKVVENKNGFPFETMIVRKDENGPFEFT